jgi:hypothetical protein
MRMIVRRVRAALTLAALWGAVSGAIGLVIGLVIAVQRSQFAVLPHVGWWWVNWHTFVARFATSWAMGGALIAIGFAGVVAGAERGRGATALSAARFTLWGGLAGGGVYGAWWVVVTHLRGRSLGAMEFPLLSLLTAIVIGAGSAWLTLRIARRSRVEPPLTGLEQHSRPGSDLLSAGALLDMPRQASARAKVT